MLDSLQRGYGFDASRRALAAKDRKTLDRLVARGYAKLTKGVSWNKSGAYVINRNEVDEGTVGREREAMKEKKFIVLKAKALNDLIDSGEDALERLEASQPPTGGRTEAVCKRLKSALQHARHWSKSTL
jgi:hypothetical protein